jgi:hypothetical protein
VILAMVGDRATIVWEGGQLDVLEASEREEARIRRAFEKPVRHQVSVEIPGGGIEERMERIAPGSADHARAVIRSFRGARVLLDNEP